ncbi:MAG: KH domain-containing protein [Kiritimatiellia bacterium]|jgi:predicted RNA-binding protein YlqC (UPF0109 family)
MALTDYLRTMIGGLVDHPDEVKITELNGAKTQVYELRCHSDDIGKVIGKNGKAIIAIRSLMSQVAARQGLRATVEVVE